MREILTIKPNSMTDAQMGVNYLASLGFEQSESAMYQDTEAHVLESDCIQLGAMLMVN